MLNGGTRLNQDMCQMPRGLICPALFFSKAVFNCLTQFFGVRGKSRLLNPNSGLTCFALLFEGEVSSENHAK